MHSNPQVVSLFRQIMAHCRDERKSKTGVSVRELAKALGKTENYISSLEHGREFPSFKTFLHYLLVLGFDTSTLTQLMIDEGSVKSTEAKAKHALMKELYSLDESEVAYLAEQTRLIRRYKVRPAKAGKATVKKRNPSK